MKHICSITVPDIAGNETYLFYLYSSWYSRRWNIFVPLQFLILQEMKRKRTSFNSWHKWKHSFNILPGIKLRKVEYRTCSSVATTQDWAVASNSSIVSNILVILQQRTMNWFWKNLLLDMFSDIYQINTENNLHC